MYEQWKSQVLGPPALAITEVQGIINPFGIECVTVGWHYANFLFPTIPIAQSISTGNARTVFASASPAYFQKIPNTVIGGCNVVLQQGDIACFDATPKPGWTNQYSNQDGHEGVVDSWDANGMTLVEQDGSDQSLPVHTKYVEYNYDPLIGVLRPILGEDMFITDSLARKLLTLSTLLAQSGAEIPDRQPTMDEILTALGNGQRDVEEYIDYLLSTAPWQHNHLLVQVYDVDTATLQGKINTLRAQNTQLQTELTTVQAPSLPSTPVTPETPPTPVTSPTAAPGKGSVIDFLKSAVNFILKGEK